MDETLAIRGRRVLQPFVDFDFSTHESMVAENSKIENIEQVLGTATLQADLQAMGLTVINQQLAVKTGQLIQLIDQRSMESAGIEKGELRAAREALYAKYLELVEYINAVQVIQPEDSLGGAVLYYNADLKKIEEQIAQGGSQPTVLVRSEVVGNHRYSVPEFSKWEDIVLANENAVDASNEYELVEIGGLTSGGGSSEPEVTPVTPE